MIRKAKIKDIDQIVILVNKFFIESLKEYGLRINNNTIKETALVYINNHIVIVAEENSKIVGVIGGMVSPSMFDPGLIGQETMWYVSNDFRKGRVGFKLIKAFEDKCKELGAYMIIMVHMENLYSHSLDKFYRARNYKLMEKQYIKGV